jgi:transcriptional regulator with XRE-family HTH domain
MQMLKIAREQRNISQRSLAKRAGVSFRCVQQLEEAGHNWRVSSMQRVVHALDLPPNGIDYCLHHFLSIVPDSVEDISIRIHVGEANAWKLHLFDFIDSFRRDGDLRHIDRPPIPDMANKMQSLIASTVESLCHEKGVPAPAWCHGIPALAHPWFVSEMENLKAMALVESPVFFRARNIFVLENFLTRV